MELHEDILTPYHRASDTSSFQIDCLHVTGKSAKFDNGSFGPVGEGFFENNATRIRLYGNEMRAYWNSTFRDSAGLTVKVTDIEDSGDGETWCDIFMGIIAVPMASIMLTGYRRRGQIGQT